jgi:hypothetical protein
MDEYLRQQLPFGALAGLLGRSQIFSSLTAATPGLSELLTVGKVWERQFHRRHLRPSRARAHPDAGALGDLLCKKGGDGHPGWIGGLSIAGMESREVGIVAAGAGLTRYELLTQRASLEDAFMELTHEHADFHAAHRDQSTSPLWAR